MAAPYDYPHDLVYAFWAGRGMPRGLVSERFKQEIKRAALARWASHGCPWSIHVWHAGMWWHCRALPGGNGLRILGAPGGGGSIETAAVPAKRGEAT